MENTPKNKLILTPFQSLVRVDWLWNLIDLLIHRVSVPCFNPSCGLIGCGTNGRVVHTSFSVMFQSLVRVDWLWNYCLFCHASRLVGFQSLVRVDWLWNVYDCPAYSAVHKCFNPSCGLIGCGTRRNSEVGRKFYRFQSLVRVDWLWN